MNQHQVVISLLDVFAFVRETFREIALCSMQQHTQQRPSAFTTVVFEPYEFLTKLVEDINLGDDRPRRQQGGAEVTIAVLTQAGMDAQNARWIYHQCWMMVIDLLSAFLPEATTGGNSAWDYQLCQGMDLVVTLPGAQSEVSAPAGFQTIAEELSSIPAMPAVPTAVPGSRPSHALDWLLTGELAMPPQLTSAELNLRYQREYGRGT